VIGLDTNVLVRLFVEDDAKQAKSARTFVKTRCSMEQPGFVDRVALCEMVWVLGRAHGYARAAIADIVEALLASTDMILEDEALVRSATRAYRDRAIDFADALIGGVNRARGCEATATFDRTAAKLDGFIRIM
jgi:predicted nucleic-acid-binding protein